MTITERVRGTNAHEGTTTRRVEEATSALPSLFWIAAAGASIVGSLALKISGRDRDAMFVGQWAPMFMLIGVYNKLVKVWGSDRARVFH